MLQVAKTKRANFRSIFGFLRASCYSFQHKKANSKVNEALQTFLKRNQYFTCSCVIIQELLRNLCGKSRIGIAFPKVFVPTLGTISFLFHATGFAVVQEVNDQKSHELFSSVATLSCIRNSRHFFKSERPQKQNIENAKLLWFSQRK